MWTQRCKKEVDVLLGGFPARETHGGAPGQAQRIQRADRSGPLQQSGQHQVGGPGGPGGPNGQRMQKSQSLDQIFHQKAPGEARAERAAGSWGGPFDEREAVVDSLRSTRLSHGEQSSSSMMGSTFAGERRRRSKDGRSEASKDDYSDLPGNWPLHQGTMMTLRPNARVRTVLDQDLVHGCDVQLKFESKRVKYGVTDDMVYNSFVPKFRVTHRGRKERLGQSRY